MLTTFISFEERRAVSLFRYLWTGEKDGERQRDVDKKGKRRMEISPVSLVFDFTLTLDPLFVLMSTDLCKMKRNHLMKVK